MTRPSLLDIIFGHVQEAGIEPETVHHIEIRHDDDCAHWSGDGCDCEPEVESGTRVERKYGGDS